MSRSYPAPLQLDERVRLVAIHDPDQTALDLFGKETGVKTLCTTFDELLAKIDIVILTSPAEYHAPQACEALARGIHVLSEVPAVVSHEQSQELVAAVRMSDALYAMAENYLYMPPHLIVRELVRAGELGALYYGETDHLADIKPMLRDLEGRPNWYARWLVGRDGNTYPTHSLGPLLQWFEDRVVAVSCVGSGRHTEPEHELQDTTVMLARTVRGSLLRVRLDWLSNRPFSRWHHYGVQGTRGAYDQGNPARGTRPAVYRRGRSADGQWEPLAAFEDRFFPSRYQRPRSGLPAWGHPDIMPLVHQWLVTDFVDAVLGARDPEIDVYAALDMTLPGIASEASIAQHGAWIHVPNPRLFSAGISPESSRR